MRSSAPCPLGITVSRRGDTTMVLLAGELDLAGEERLRARLHAVLADRPHPPVLELSGLEFLDCTGLSVMIWVRNQLHQRCAALQIRNPRSAVRRVLALGALTRHMSDPTWPARGDAWPGGGAAAGPSLRDGGGDAHAPVHPGHLQIVRDARSRPEQDQLPAQRDRSFPAAHQRVQPGGITEPHARQLQRDPRRAVHQQRAGQVIVQYGSGGHVQLTHYHQHPPAPAPLGGNAEPLAAAECGHRPSSPQPIR